MGGKTPITAPLTVYTQRMSTMVSKLEIKMLGDYVLSIPELIYYPLYLNQRRKANVLDTMHNDCKWTHENMASCARPRLYLTFLSFEYLVGF